MNAPPIVLRKSKPETELNFSIVNLLNNPRFSGIRQLACLISEMPFAVISLSGRDNRWISPEQHPSLSAKHVMDLLLDRSIAEEAYFEVADLSADTDFHDKILLAEDRRIHYYAGYPLIHPDGYPLGALSIFDYNPGCQPESRKQALQILASELVQIISDIHQKEETKHFDRLLDVSKDLICTIGADGFFIKINAAFETVLGWDREYLLRTSLFDLVHKDDIVGTLKAVSRLTSGNSITKFTHRICTKSGHYKSLQWVTSPEPATGTFFAVARDISEEKERELKLKISENNLKSFFENSQGLMCTHDPQGRFITVNNAGADMLGYSVKEILRMSLYDLVPVKHHTSLTSYLNEIAATGKANGIMITQHKNGSPRIWMYNNVLGKTDGLAYIIGNAIDITERHYLEKDLHKTREILEQTSRLARIGGWEYDLLRQKLYWSDITKLIHDVDQSYEPGLDEAIRFYKPGESRDKVIEIFEKARRDGEEWDIELQLVTAKGREIWVKAQGNAEVENGICRRLYGTFQDITELINQREELEKAKQVAEQASIAKSEFLANMSHEIRTPLNGVIGFADLVLKTNLTETQKQYLSIVHQSGNALLNIISDILDFSKIEAGKLELDISKFDLYELASQTADIISYQAQNKKLELLLNIPADLPRFMWADSIRLKQVLINLLSNAIKFTDKGEIELKVDRLADRSDGQTTFRFEVRDTGIGIPFDKQHKIFEAFLQEDASITRKYGGTGLGLTISNKLLGLMGSHLKVESTPGYGSRFYFELSVKTEHGEAVQWTGTESVKKVLIVDDNDNNRLILKQMLLLKDVESDEATNGFEALNLLARGNRYDAIFVDYHMPHMDGLETIRKIRKNFSDPSFEQKIILLYSSSNDEQMINASEELHITSRLAKPIKMHDIYANLFHGRKDGSLQLNQETTEKTISHSLTVLIAEDNNANMLLAKTIVKRIAPNARVVEACNGREALKKYQSEKPDIIFMDVQMPEMNGCETTTAIRAIEQEGHTPIIALTASNIKGEQERCLLAGMDGFLSKPFSEADLTQQFIKWTLIEGNNYKQPPAPAPEEEKTSVYFDLEQVINYLDGDTVFLVEFLDITRAELDGSMNELQTAAQAADLTALNAAAHKLKGTALIAGMDKLSNLAKVLEKLSEFHQPVVNDLVHDVQKEIEIVIEHINAAKKSM